MKTFTLTTLLVLLSTFASYAQSSISDSLQVSNEHLIDVNIKRLTQELKLSTEQQEQARQLFLRKNIIVMPDDSFSEFFELLTTEQHLMYETILEQDENTLNAYNKARFMRSAPAYGAHTITLNDAEHFKDVRIGLNNHPSDAQGVNTNYSNYKIISLMAWTMSGETMFARSLLKFVLNDIPIGAEIVSATLHLYSDPTQTASHSVTSNCTTSGSNAFYIEQISQAWNDLTVTWNTMPESTTTGRILVPTSTSVTENIQINLTDMVQQWVNAPNTNYGIKMFLQTESRYRARSYASMEHSNTAIRPKLVVSYNISEVAENILSTIEYIYDASGNRIRREVIVIPAQTRSTTKSVDNNTEPIESSWNNFAIKIYPNPTHGDISIRFEGELSFEQAQYRLYSTSGNMVGNGYINAAGTNPVEMSQLPAGIYILTLQYNNETKTYKIIKK